MHCLLRSGTTGLWPEVLASEDGLTSYTAPSRPPGTAFLVPSTSLVLSPTAAASRKMPLSIDAALHGSHCMSHISCLSRTHINMLSKALSRRSILRACYGQILGKDSGMATSLSPISLMLSHRET